MKTRLMLASYTALLGGDVFGFSPTTTTTTRTGDTKLAVTSFSYWSSPSSTSAYSSYSSSPQSVQASSNKNSKSDPFANSSMWSARNAAAGRSRQNCYYRILGVPIAADQATMKRAFRQLVKQYHPDANPHADTTTEFQMINRAYQVLSDSHQRQKYDARMGYRDDQPQHFIVSDMEDASLRREQEQYQQDQEHPFGNLSNDQTGSSWQVRNDGRMFLMDDGNDGIPFRM